MEVTFTLDEIEAVAEKIIPMLASFKIVAVHGEMGSGKTTFIQAVCKKMGVTDKMCSPTYSIIQQYETTTGLTIHHLDIYRLKDIEEAIQAGVEDAINSGDFCFIEWPEKIANILPLRFITIFIERVNDAKRKLVVNISERIIFNA